MLEELQVLIIFENHGQLNSFLKTFLGVTTNTGITCIIIVARVHLEYNLFEIVPSFFYWFIKTASPTQIII